MVSSRVTVVALLAITLVIRFDQGVALKCRVCSSKDDQNCSKDPEKIEQTECKSEPPAGNTSPSSGIPADTTEAGITGTDNSIPSSTPKDDTTVSKTPASTPKDDTTVSENPASTPKDDTTVSKTPASTPKDDTTVSETPASMPKDDTTVSENPASTPKDDTTVSETSTSTPKDDTTVSETSPSTIPSNVPSTESPGVTSGGDEDEGTAENQPDEDGEENEKPQALQIFSRFRRNAPVSRADDEFVCYKLVYTSGDDNIVERGCAPKENGCATLKQQEGKSAADCYVCEKDGCNASSSISFGIISIIIPVGIFTIYGR